MHQRPQLPALLPRTPIIAIAVISLSAQSLTQATQLVDAGLPPEYCKPKTAEHGGYYDPEYSRSGVMDKSTDIYCFGVVR